MRRGRCKRSQFDLVGTKTNIPQSGRVLTTVRAFIVHLGVCCAYLALSDALAATERHWQ
jgi:hypothetical protein